jgi:bifunctional DNA-binding transcriptional regulator/antitoxin component of YhaV-PrlF toxin-antitoxin module
MADTIMIGERGRITLPPETIEAMGWKPGQRLRLSVSGESMFIKAFPQKHQPVRPR